MDQTNLGELYGLEPIPWSRALEALEVADALGVSVSTIQRWVDAGSIEATRTMGKHRRVLLSSVLEFARRGYDELEVFRDLKPSIGVGLGVIDIKDNEVEAPAHIARRIEHAVKTLGPGRVQWVHPDCGFWMLPRSIADRKMRALVEGRNLYCG